MKGGDSVTSRLRRACRAAAGVVLGLLARAWLATLRVEVRVDRSLWAAASVPWVLAFYHGTQWPLLAWKRRRGTVVLVSWSADGALQARALRVLGFAVVRGSSSRGGARGLAALVRTMRSRRMDAAFAVDGPRGPYGVVQGGAAAAARACGGVLVPMGGAVAHGVTLARTWDRFVIAWPFSRVVVALGPPINPDAVTACEELSEGITRANERARALVAHVAGSFALHRGPSSP